MLPSSTVEVRCPDRVQELGYGPVVQQFGRLNRLQPKIDLHGMALAGADSSTCGQSRATSGCLSISPYVVRYILCTNRVSKWGMLLIIDEVKVIWQAWGWRHSLSRPGPMPTAIRT